MDKFETLIGKLGESIEVLVVGLPSAGKKEIMKKMPIHTSRSVSVSNGIWIKEFTYGNIKFSMFHIIGPTPNEIHTVSDNFSKVDAVIYVADSSDHEQLIRSSDSLHTLLSEDILSKSLLLVLANKEDMTTFPLERIADFLKLRLLERPWFIVATNGITGSGISKAIELLVNFLEPKTADFSVMKKREIVQNCPECRSVLSTCWNSLMDMLAFGETQDDALRKMQVTECCRRELLGYMNEFLEGFGLTLATRIAVKFSRLSQDIRVCMVGLTGSGKTTLLKNCGNLIINSQNGITTEDVEFKRIKFCSWTVGDQSGTSYGNILHSTNAIFFVLDGTNEENMAAARLELHKILRKVGTDVVLLIISNKSDLPFKHKAPKILRITLDLGSVTQAYKIVYISALSGFGVESMMYDFVDLYEQVHPRAPRKRLYRAI